MVCFSGVNGISKHLKIKPINTSWDGHQETKYWYLLTSFQNWWKAATENETLFGFNFTSIEYKHEKVAIFLQFDFFP